MFDPIPHYKQTGFRRDEDFQEISCHYDPALAGDARNAGLTKKLEKLVAAGQAGPQEKAAEDAGEKKVVVNQWATIYLYETKSLISGLSFQEDLAAYTDETARMVAEAIASGDSLDSVPELAQRLVDSAIQPSPELLLECTNKGTCNSTTYPKSHAAPASVESLLSIM